jgi:DNA repair protein RadC
MKKTDSSVEPLVEDRLSDMKPADLNDVEKQSVITLAMKVLAIKHRAGRTLSKPEETRDYLRLCLADYRNEVFGCLFFAECGLL